MSKKITRLRIVNWGIFQRPRIVTCKDFNLFVGSNGTGKTMSLDALTYLLFGNTKFNIAAQDRARNTAGMVHGATTDPSRPYLRGSGMVYSYIFGEFLDTETKTPFVLGVCIESSDSQSVDPYRFAVEETRLEDIRFCSEDGKQQYSHSRITIKGKTLPAAQWMPVNKGLKQFMQILGITAPYEALRNAMNKMGQFRSESNIEDFIKENVLDKKTVTTLDALRRMRESMTQAQIEFDRLQKQEQELDVIEKLSGEYERQKQNLERSRARNAYRQYREVADKKKDLTDDLANTKTRYGIAERESRALEEKLKKAEETVRNAYAELGEGVQLMLNEQKATLKETDNIIHECENAIAKLLRFRQDANGFAGMYDKPLWTEEDEKILSKTDGQPVEEVIRVFHLIVQHLADAEDRARAEKAKVSAQLEQATNRRAQEENIVRTMIDTGSVQYPSYIRKAKEVLTKHFVAKGIDIKPRTLAELVEEFTDPVWQKSVEAYLGDRRFHIIVPGKYSDEAYAVIRRERIFRVTIPYTDRIREIDDRIGTAAGLLVIANPEARAYADYMLGRMKLCVSDAEMKEAVSKGFGGITKDGDVAYQMGRHLNDIDSTSLYMGEKAYEIMLKRHQEELSILRQEEQSLNQEISRWDLCIRKASRIDKDETHYNFQAAVNLNEETRKKDILIAEIKAMEEENQDIFTAIMNAEKNRDRIADERNGRIREAGALGERMTSLEQEIKKTGSQENKMEEEFIEKVVGKDNLRNDIIRDYDAILKKTGEPPSWSTRTIEENGYALNRALNEMMDAQRQFQRNYMSTSSEDELKVGPSYMSYFRAKRKRTENVDIERAQAQLAKSRKETIQSFFTDFIDLINSQIRDAISELSNLNRDLKGRMFGKQQYQFVWKRREDDPAFAPFFNIANQIEMMIAPEYIANTLDSNEELSAEISEFLEIVLQGDNEHIYSDYREYLTLDMEIYEPDTDNRYMLSKKSSSSSTGEKQTPHLIILASCLNRLYGKSVGACKIAVMDEAFAAFSSERIEQMLDYFRTSGFQVFFAAPDDALSKIGKYMDSIITCFKPAGKMYSQYIDGFRV